MKQRTIKKPCVFKGRGLHSGQDVCLKIFPAAPNSGISFTRTDLETPVTIAANAESAEETRMCTSIAKDGVKIHTIEHLMAAVNALSIDNLDIRIDAPEVPIMDGSSKLFISALDHCGQAFQNENKKFLRVLKKISVEESSRTATLHPSPSRSFSFTIDFDNPVIGQQSYDFNLTDETSFQREIAEARTFGFLKDAEWLQKNGLGLGASEENAIIINEQNQIINRGGLRYKNEFVRHKILDAIGDIYLAGFQIIGHYLGVKSSHAINIRLLKELFSSKDNYALVSA